MALLDELAGGIGAQLGNGGGKGLAAAALKLRNNPGIGAVDQAREAVQHQQRGWLAGWRGAARGIPPRRPGRRQGAHGQVMPRFMGCGSRRRARLATVIGVAVAGVLALGAPAHAAEVTVYKTASCGCCNAWIRHLEANGFAVRAHNVGDLDALKRRFGVAPQLAACHTAFVDGYVVEGHVPAADIKRLLAERPKVKGIAVPGMPMGSPGMEGPTKEPYSTVTFDDAGRIKVYARH